MLIRTTDLESKRKRALNEELMLIRRGCTDMYDTKMAANDWLVQRIKHTTVPDTHKQKKKKKQNQAPYT